MLRIRDDMLMSSDDDTMEKICELMVMALRIYCTAGDDDEIKSLRSVIQNHVLKLNNQALRASFDCSVISIIQFYTVEVAEDVLSSNIDSTATSSGLHLLPDGRWIRNYASELSCSCPEHAIISDMLNAVPKDLEGLEAAMRTHLDSISNVLDPPWYPRLLEDGRGVRWITMDGSGDVKSSSSELHGACTAYIHNPELSSNTLSAMISYRNCIDIAIKRLESGSTEILRCASTLRADSKLDEFRSTEASMYHLYAILSDMNSACLSSCVSPSLESKSGVFQSMRLYIQSVRAFENLNKDDLIKEAITSNNMYLGYHACGDATRASDRFKRIVDDRASMIEGSDYKRNQNKTIKCVIEADDYLRKNEYESLYISGDD